MVACHPADHPRAHLGIVAELATFPDGTLRATASGRTVAELIEAYGPLRILTWEAWRAEAAAAQAAEPARWEPCPAAEYQTMLEVLPPVAWDGGSFAVGEPTDHDHATGRPRFVAYRARRTALGMAYARSARPVTVADLRANRHTALGQPWGAP